LYFVGIAAVWYENRFIACDVLHRPLFLRQKNQTVFRIMRLLITYGSLACVWYSYGWIPALLGLFPDLLFQRITSRGSYKREYHKHYTRYIEDFRQRMTSDGHTVDERVLRSEASELAHKTIQRNLKGDSD
jgi:hypothetical protein